MIRIEQEIELNLSRGSDAVLDLVAYSLKEGQEITEKVLTDHFGFSDKTCGGDDPRLFILTYLAKDVQYKSSVLFERIKCDLKSLIQKIPFKPKDPSRERRGGRANLNRSIPTQIDAAEEIISLMMYLSKQRQHVLIAI